MILSNVFEIGEYSNLGFNYIIDGNEVRIGDHFYHSSGLRVGGGGSNGPRANLTVGDRCTFHDNFINVCEPVEIGDDVGLSPEVSIITHGFWQSVLEGYPRKFAPVKIGNGVIVGYRSIILPGVEIADNCVIGAGSVVAKSLKSKGIYAGNPAKWIGDITPPTEREQHRMALELLIEYRRHNDVSIEFKFPEVRINDFTINLLTFAYRGRETKKTDKFRDYLRKYGIRIYTKRPFG